MGWGGVGWEPPIAAPAALAAPAMVRASEPPSELVRAAAAAAAAAAAEALEAARVAKVAPPLQVPPGGDEQGGKDEQGGRGEGGERSKAVVGAEVAPEVATINEARKPQKREPRPRRPGMRPWRWVRRAAALAVVATVACTVACTAAYGPRPSRTQRTRRRTRAMWRRRRRRTPSDKGITNKALFALPAAAAGVFAGTPAFPFAAVNSLALYLVLLIQ